MFKLQHRIFEYCSVQKHFPPSFLFDVCTFYQLSDFSDVMHDVAIGLFFIFEIFLMKFGIDLPDGYLRMFLNGGKPVIIQ